MSRDDTLKARGFRLVLKPVGAWGWVHPQDIQPGDVDATDLGDAEFEALVRAEEAAR